MIDNDYHMHWHELDHHGTFIFSILYTYRRDACINNDKCAICFFYEQQQIE